MEPKGEAGGVRVLDTYAHHPTELAADLRAARAIAGAGRVIAVFQPHLFSRTRIFATEFGAALGLADEAVVLDVYAAREDPEPGVTGKLVADAVPGGAARYVESLDDVPRVVASIAAPGDLVLTMGAGDVTRLGPLGRSPRSRGRRPDRIARDRIAGGCPAGRLPAAAPPAPRTRTPWRAAFFALAAFGIVAGVAWALFGSRLLVVQSVTVTGTHLVTPAQVLAAADVPAGTPLIGVNTAQVAQRVESIRQVASAAVSKDWPDHLVITVTERVPVVAVRMNDGGYDLVDPAGVIVRWSKPKPARLPLYLTSLTGGALHGDPGVAATAAVLAELPLAISRGHRGGGRPGHRDDRQSGGPADVTLYLTGHKTVVWGGADRASEKDRELAIVMRDHARYFDVSAPGTVVTG